MWFDQDLGILSRETEHAARTAFQRGARKVVLDGWYCVMREDEYGIHVEIDWEATEEARAEYFDC